MKPRTLDSIISEIRGVYQPQLDSVRKRQSLIPQAIRSEEQGLAAKQSSAFDEILGGARRRGLGFSGLPVGEQYKYNATEYQPALARLRQSGQEQALSLEDAILGVNERMQNQALGIRQYEQQRYDSFQEAERQRRAQAAAAASERSILDAIYNANTNKTPAAKDDPIRDEVVGMINKRDFPRLVQSYSASMQQAARGNKEAQRRVEYLRALQPNLFPKNGSINIKAFQSGLLRGLPGLPARFKKQASVWDFMKSGTPNTSYNVTNGRDRIAM